MKLAPYKFVNDAEADEKVIMQSKAGLLRTKLNNGGHLGKNEALWLTRMVNSSSYFKDGIAVLGWKIPFTDVLKKYFVEYAHGSINKYYATSKFALRKTIGYSSNFEIFEVR